MEFDLNSLYSSALAYAERKFERSGRPVSLYHGTNSRGFFALWVRDAEDGKPTNGEYVKLFATVDCQGLKELEPRMLFCLGMGVAR